MKQRNAFTTDNSPGLDEHERKHANALFDAWARKNPYHGKDTSAWQQRAGEAQRRFVEAIVSQRVPMQTTAAARAPVRVPHGSGPPKPPLLPGQTVGEVGDQTPDWRWQAGQQIEAKPLGGAESVTIGPGDVGEVDPNTLQAKE